MSQVTKWNLKRSWGIPLASVILQILFITIPVLMQGRHDLDTYTALTTFTPIILINLTEYILVMLLVIRSFGFLHKREDSHFIFSLPESRLRLFWDLNLSAFILLLLPRLFGLVNRIFLGTAFSTQISFKPIVEGELKQLLMCCAIYVFLLFFYTVSGSGFNAVLFFLMANFTWPIFILALRYMGGLMLPNSPVWYRGFGEEIWERLLYLPFSPLIDAPIALITSTAMTFYWLGFTLMLGLVSCLIFVRRPAERAEGEEYHSWPFVIIKVITAAAAGCILAIIFCTVRLEIGRTDGHSIPAMITGLAAGSLLASFLLELLLSRGRANFRQSLKQTGIAWLPLALAMALLMTGFMGYSEKLPDTQKSTQLFISSDQDRGVMYDKSESIAVIRRLIDTCYDPENPGLELPRSLASRQIYQNYITEKMVRHARPFAVEWSEGVRSFRRSFYIDMDRLYDILEPLMQDPATQLFFWGDAINNNYSLSHAYLGNMYVEGGKAEVPEEWSRLIQALRTDKNLPYSPAVLLDKLSLDYASFNEDERAALKDRAFAFAGFGKPERDLSEEIRTANDKKMAEMLDHMRLPITSGCVHTYDYLKRIVDAAERNENRTFIAETAPPISPVPASTEYPTEEPTKTSGTQTP